MKVAFGIKAHSGWAALVVVGKRGGEFVVVDRRRMELVADAWAKQPFHAAEKHEPDEARAIVERGIAEAQRIAERELQAALQRERGRNNEVTNCAVLVGNAMPDWSVEEILAVHFRMHKAEGVLFRRAALHAAEMCGLRAIPVPEKTLLNEAEKILKLSSSDLLKQIAAMGKVTGPPWGKDQKDASLAAMVALYAKPRTKMSF